MGLVAMWDGEIADIPSGWHLCDGLDGTVDLRDLFVIGAGHYYNPGDAGGSMEHTHPFASDGHDHALMPGEFVAAGTGFSNVTSVQYDTGITEPTSSLGPWYALAFIECMWGTP